MRPRCAAALAALLLTGCAARTVVYQNELPDAATAPRSAPAAPFYEEQLAWYGSVGLMDGPTLLYCVYLNEPGGNFWDDAAVAQTRQSLTVAAGWLEEQAADWGAEDFSLVYGEELSAAVTVNHHFNGEDGDEDFLTQLDTLCARLNTETLRNTYGADSIGFLFFLPAAGASCTYPHYAEDGMWYTNEYSLLYAEDIYSDPGTPESPAVYAHEILHLFGAPDLYEGSADYFVTNELADYVSTQWPDAIMADTYNEAGGIDYDRIDKSLCPLTAFRLGLCDSFEGLARFPTVAELPAGVFASEARAIVGLPVTEAV